MHEHPGGIGAELGAQAASAPFPLAGVVIGGGLLLFLVAYAALVRAGRRRGRAWSDARTLSAAAGVVAGVVAVGPLGVLGHHDFTAHMWGHLLLGMLTPLLRRLDHAGLVTRARSADDERRRLISLAPAGRDLREAAADIPARMADLYPGPAGQREELKAFLDELAAGLD